jgi:hypothetical protein
MHYHREKQNFLFHSQSGPWVVTPGHWRWRGRWLAGLALSWLRPLFGFVAVAVGLFWYNAFFKLFELALIFGRKVTALALAFISVPGFWVVRPANSPAQVFQNRVFVDAVPGFIYRGRLALTALWFAEGFVSHRPGQDAVWQFFGLESKVVAGEVMSLDQGAFFKPKRSGDFFCSSITTDQDCFINTHTKGPKM